MSCGNYSIVNLLINVIIKLVKFDGGWQISKFAHT